MYFAYIFAMKLAIAVWNGRVSPLFDTSKSLEVFDVENGKSVLRDEVPVPETEPFAKTAWLSELKIEALICGAISQPLAEMIVARGIRLISFIAGEKDEVLAAFASGTLPLRRLAMPGCRCGRMRMRGWSGGRGRGRGLGGE